MCVCKKLHCEVCGNQIDASAELIKERDALRAQIESIRNDQLYIAAANERDALRAALEQIEMNTRNASVVGHPGITCRECEETNLACSEALNKKD